MVKMSERDSDGGDCDQLWRLRFLRSPSEIISKDGRLTGIKFVHNTLEVTVMQMVMD